ncbi:hypothetical protein JHK82_022915 [Glycine max]|nr:hypothetical protein JHK86_022960 [Glycine max]KAG5138184.1 hypothetical protein JHK82_022915 [Glycine max]
MALSRVVAQSSQSNLLKPLASYLSLRRRSVSTSSDPLTIETSVPFTSHNCDAPSRAVETSSAELFAFFHDMALMRRMEIAADSLYKAKLIRGFCHLYDGQEAVAVGMEAAITRKDCVITAYRDHCTFLARGGTLIEIFSELMGRRDGCSKGKGGSMHFYRKEGGFYGGHGIVGAQVPLGCGLAFAQKYCKDENVTFSMYGDGAANQGQLFEALNISALWDLPSILVCENNHYGMGTAEWRAAKSPAYYKRGDYVPGLKLNVCLGNDSSYWVVDFVLEEIGREVEVIPCLHQYVYYCLLVLLLEEDIIFVFGLVDVPLSLVEWKNFLVDGMDALAVKQACKFAKEFALKNGPIILEMDTYRYHGHSMSDPGSTYRTRDEISGVRQERDPIERVRKLLLTHEIATEKELKDIEKEIRKEVDEAIAKAKSSVFISDFQESQMPEPSDLFTNVYVKGFGVENLMPPGVKMWNQELIIDLLEEVNVEVVPNTPLYDAIETDARI